MLRHNISKKNRLRNIFHCIGCNGIYFLHHLFSKKATKKQALHVKMCNVPAGRSPGHTFSESQEKDLLDLQMLDKSQLLSAPSIGGISGRSEIECPRNTRILGRRIPGILVGIVSSLEASFWRSYFKNPAGSATQTSTQNSGRTCVLAFFKSTGGRLGGGLGRRQGGSSFDLSLFLKLIQKSTFIS